MSNLQNIHGIDLYLFRDRILSSHASSCLLDRVELMTIDTVIETMNNTDRPVGVEIRVKDPKKFTYDQRMFVIREEQPFYADIRIRKLVEELEKKAKKNQGNYNDFIGLSVKAYYAHNGVAEQLVGISVNP